MLWWNGLNYKIVPILTDLISEQSNLIMITWRARMAGVRGWVVGVLRHHWLGMHHHGVTVGRHHVRGRWLGHHDVGRLQLRRHDDSWLVGGKLFGSPIPSSNEKHYSYNE